MQHALDIPGIVSGGDNREMSAARLGGFGLFNSSEHDTASLTIVWSERQFRTGSMPFDAIRHESLPVIRRCSGRSILRVFAALSGYSFAVNCIVCAACARRR